MFQNSNNFCAENIALKMGSKNEHIDSCLFLVTVNVLSCQIYIKGISYMHTHTHTQKKSTKVLLNQIIMMILTEEGLNKTTFY